jgi:hypothetical protein
MGGRYPAGQLVRMATYGGTIASPTLGFRDVNGNLIDPATVQLKFAVGGAAPTTYTYGGGQIVHDGVGLYHYDLDTTGMGGSIVVYEWISPTQTIQSNSFFVTTDAI